MKVTILCENFAPTSFGIVSEHGFAALVEAEDKTILFDTGQGLGLTGNAKLLGVNLDQVDILAFSHGHLDHTGGIPAFFASHKVSTVVAHPECFDKKFAERKIGEQTFRLPIGIPWQVEEFERRGVEMRLSKAPVEVAKGVWFSGEVPARNDFEHGDPNLKVETPDGLVPDPFNDDAALFIRTDKGLSVISGCAHRGIINTMDRALEVIGDVPIYAVIGGMHLGGVGAERIQKTVEALRARNPRIVAAGHCTGQESASLLREGLGSVFKFMSVGQRFEL